MNRRFRAGARAVRLLPLLALGALLGMPDPAGADITVGFVHPDTTSVADTLAVLVTVDAQATDLRGFSMVVKFDPDLVSLVSVQPGSLLVNAGCPHFLEWLNAPEVAAGDSLIVFDGAALGCSVAGPGDIVRLDFYCEVPGSSPISCESVDLRDSLNQSLAHVCVPGTIICEEPISVEATTWGRVKSGYWRGGSPPR